MVRKFLQETSGATAIEYGLIVSLVSLGLFAGLSNYYNAFTLIFNFIVAHMAV